VVNESAPKPAKISVKSRRWYALLVFGVAVGGCALWLKARLNERAARKEYQSRLDAIRADGKPVDLHDLARLYPDPPPDHDAIRLLQPGLSLLVIPNDSKKIPHFGEDWRAGNAPFDKKSLEEIQSILEKNQKAFDAVPWGELKTAWIGSSLQKGSRGGPVLPLVDISHLTKLFCLNACLQAQIHNSTGAVQSLQRAWAIHDTFRNDTVLNGAMKLAMERLNCAALNRVLNRTPLTDSELAVLSDCLPRTNLGTTKELTINQRSFEVTIAEELKAEAKHPKRRSESTVGYIRGKVQIQYRDQDWVDYLDEFNRSLAALDLPLSNAIPKLTALGREEAAYRRQVEKQNTGPISKLFGIEDVWLLVANSPGQIGKSLVQEAKTLAYTRAARTALAVERWRLMHDGHPPDSLSELVPELFPSVPKDPFGDRPLRYKKDGLGYTIYSIGPDYEDNNAKEETTNEKESDRYDIVFSVAR
jgi:hypothetical protein